MLMVIGSNDKDKSELLKMIKSVFELSTKITVGNDQTRPEIMKSILISNHSLIVSLKKLGGKSLSRYIIPGKPVVKVIMSEFHFIKQIHIM
jgi:hypothetical protein